MLEAERRASASVLENPANFGHNFDRQCICAVPGQIPCPGFKEMPKEMQGKWQHKMRIGDVTLEEVLELNSQRLNQDR